MCSSSTKLVYLILNFCMIGYGYGSFDIPIRNRNRPPTSGGADIWTIASANTHFDERCVSRYGIVPDPEDCGQYIVCSVNRAYLRRCPPFTLFDYNQKQCVYFSSAECFTSEKIVCPKRFGLFRHRKCDRYWACANGKARLKFCPAFKRFDVRYKQCRISLWADCTDEAASIPSTTVTEIPPTTTISIEQSTIASVPSSTIENKANLSSTVEDNSSNSGLTTPAVSFSTGQKLTTAQTTIPLDQPLDSQTIGTSKPSQTITSLKPIIEMDQSSTSIGSILESDLVLTTLEPILESNQKRPSISEKNNKTSRPTTKSKAKDVDGTTTTEITIETSGTVTETIVIEETMATLTPLLSSSTIKESEDNEIIPSYLSSRSPSNELISPQKEEEMESSTPCD